MIAVTIGTFHMRYYFHYLFCIIIIFFYGFCCFSSNRSTLNSSCSGSINPKPRQLRLTAYIFLAVEQPSKKMKEEAEEPFVRKHYILQSKKQDGNFVCVLGDHTGNGESLDNTSLTIRRKEH